MESVTLLKVMSFHCVSHIIFYQDTSYKFLAHVIFKNNLRLRLSNG